MTHTAKARRIAEEMQALSRLQFAYAEYLVETLRDAGADEYEIDHVNLFAEKARGDTIAAATHAEIVCREIEALSAPA